MLIHYGFSVASWSGDWAVKNGPDVFDLKRSSQKVGRLYPVLLDKNGIVIDGQHRLAADAAWPKIRLDCVCSEKERLIARLISNVCRRTVSSDEKRELVERLGRICLEEGEKVGKLAHVLEEMTGMSYRWIMEYLPDKYKQRPGLGGPTRRSWVDKGEVGFDKSKVAGHATGSNGLLLSSPVKKFVSIRDYRNADFVNILLERDFYDKLIVSSTALGVSAESVINNAIILALKELESMARAQEAARIFSH